MLDASKKSVAIHQPNFLPWLGYFDKIAMADVFILMDNVQFPKTGGGVWANRVMVLEGGRAIWITVPVVRNYHGLRLIKDMEVDSSKRWRRKMLKTIEYNYRRCTHFEEQWEFVSTLLDYESGNLSDFNVHAITALTNRLGLDSTKLVLGSSLEVEGKGTELLISMTKAVGGSAYICGGGAGGYQEDELFAEAGIKLIYQDFKHPEYDQGRAEFTPGLSVIDALFHIGAEATGRLLRR